MTNTQVDDLEGKRLNENYRVSKVLHWSEHSVVCRAQRLDSNSSVDLRILDAASIKQLDQFEQSCKQNTKLKHDFIVPLLDVSKTSEGEPFISIQPFELSLDMILGTDTFDVESSARLVTQLIDGLLYLERNAEQVVLPLPYKVFLEREKQAISSENIQQRSSPRDTQRKGKTLSYTAKIAAWNMSSYLPEDLIFPTLPSEVERTKYFPPEEIHKEKLDARSQTYALACIFHQLITGRTPFASDDLVELQSQQLCSAPPRLHESRPDLYFSPKLQQVISKALEKDPSKRFRNLLEFKTALLGAAIPATRLHKTSSRILIVLLLCLVGWSAFETFNPVDGPIITMIRSYLLSNAPQDPDPFDERPHILPIGLPANGSDALSSLPPIPQNAQDLGTVTASKHLHPGNYYCDRISLVGNAQLTAEGEVNLWVKPRGMQDSVLSLGDNAVIKARKDPKAFNVYYMSQANVHLSGKSKLDCRLLAPAAAIEASDEALISGHVTSNGQILNGNSHFTHVQSD